MSIGLVEVSVLLVIFYLIPFLIVVKSAHITNKVIWSLTIPFISWFAILIPYALTTLSNQIRERRD